ncbi:MAG TPA: GtrA family protein [Mycobacterium sp.]|nr:GtrA family protein [Mycobacterium sp.]
MRALITQLVRFGLVGAVGLVIDVGVFNLLRLTVFEPSAVHEGPVYAKVISTALAIIANWVGNRYWTFGPERRPQVVREGLDFVLVSLGGMVIGLGCLWVSHYLLGYTSLLADNISTNVIGLALGTAFRFWMYRVWVFSPRHTRPAAAVPSVALHPEPALALADLEALSELPTRGSRPAPLRTPPADGPQWD